VQDVRIIDIDERHEGSIPVEPRLGRIGGGPEKALQAQRLSRVFGVRHNLCRELVQLDFWLFVRHDSSLRSSSEVSSF
jgi:hypothetical protein